MRPQRALPYRFTRNKWSQRVRGLRYLPPCGPRVALANKSPVIDGSQGCGFLSRCISSGHPSHGADQFLAITVEQGRRLDELDFVSCRRSVDDCVDTSFHHGLALASQLTPYALKIGHRRVCFGCFSYTPVRAQPRPANLPNPLIKKLHGLSLIGINKLGDAGMAEAQFAIEHERPQK